MHLTRHTAPLTLATLLIAGAGHAAQPGAPASVVGATLTGSNGMTLYTFDKDVGGSGKSACVGLCASNWPPYLAMQGETAGGDYSVVIRDAGSRQWAFKGKPLYYWSKDRKPGDKTGDGINNVWHVAAP